MERLTEGAKKFGPFEYGKCDNWSPLRLVWSSGGGEDDEPSNNLTAYAFGFVARIKMPNLIQPYRIKHMAKSWDAATVARMGRDWYFESFPREYGFSLNDGFLQLFLGAQTHDSTTTQSWSTHLPWTQWRHVRHSYYDGMVEHFWTEWTRPRGFKLRDAWPARMAIEDACPSASFEFDDYDGKRITAKTRIEEREWHFGDGWFKWLSIFKKPKIHRTLNLEFSEEVGPEKGSWKGGTTGHSIEMLPGELHEAAFKRYCDLEHRSKYAKYRIKYIGKA